MSIAIALILIVVGGLAFNFLSPWWFTPLASNWGQIDTTLMITMWVTGIVFVVVNVFVAVAIIRFRYRKDRKAAYEPENKKLEYWLIGVTAVGIVILLAPGLFVYSEFVSVPENAIVAEAVGQQWQWSFRLPGADGVLGRTSNKLVSFDNAFGLDPNDPAGQDDLLVPGDELHLPLNHPVHMQLRSKDVLHDFYVPNFRVKMDLVPGLVTSIWFTPTVAGTYEIACAEYCGLGHHVMRGLVVVEDEAAHAAWLAGQQTFAQTQGDHGTPVDPQVALGRQVAQDRGCLGCHTVDGRAAVGPSWLGLYGKQETLADGSTVAVDGAYIKESITAPAAKVVEGFPPAMPAYTNLSAQELDALVAYLASLSGNGK